MILDAIKGDLAEVHLDGVNISNRVRYVDDDLSFHTALLVCEEVDRRGHRIIEDNAVKVEELIVALDRLEIRDVRRWGRQLAAADAFAGERFTGRMKP